MSRVKYSLKSVINTVAALLVTINLTSCYSFTGASIPVEAQTFSVETIQNVASMVAPILSTTLTDALKDKFSRQTRLSQVRENGDLSFSGEITNYTSTPTAVTSSEYATMNRLTITIKIRFSNKYESKNDFDKTFSAYEDYDSNQLLQTVESALITEIVDKLVEDVFNAAVSNW